MIAVVATGGCRTTSESHDKIYFGISVVAAAKVILQAWCRIERRGGVGLWKLLVRERQEMVYWYAGMEMGNARVVV